MSPALARVFRLEARDPAAIVESYDREVTRQLKRINRRTAADLRRIRTRFVSFRSQAIATLPERFAMNQASISGITQSLSVQLDSLARDLGDFSRDAMHFQTETAQRITDAYADNFLPPRVDGPHLRTLGATTQALDLASSFSAELVGLNQGGLGAKVLGEVNRVVRLAALGAGAGAFASAAEIGKALAGPQFGPRWSWQAERIYRTEVLRIQSLSMQASIQELNRIQTTRKRWIWSGISRKEHQRAHNQTVSASGRFKIPTRSQGVVSMRFPRDPSAPPDATINCGCYLIPWPASRTARRAATRPAARRPPKARAKPPQKKPGPLKRTDTATGFQPATTLEEGLKVSRRFAQNGAARGTAEALRLRPDRIRPGSFGGKIRNKATELGQLNKINREFDRMSRLYPKIAPGNRGKLRELVLSTDKRGRAHNALAVKRAWMSVGEEWGGYGTKGYASDPIVLRHRAWEKSSGKKWNGDPRETHVAYNVRHEYGHVLDGELAINPNPTLGRKALGPPQTPLQHEWRDLMGKYTDGWMHKHVSDYSRSGSFHTKMAESWAEIFAQTTGPHYKLGTLPRDIEAFVEKAIGAAL